MNSILNIAPRLAAITLSGLMMQQLQAASATPTLDGSLQTGAPLEWTLVTAYSHSFFNRDYDSWDKESVELYCFLPDQKLLLSTAVDFDHRSAGLDDIAHGFNAAWYATSMFEVHAGVKLVDDADFLPSETYLFGMKYRVNPQLELLFDVREMNFTDQVASWDEGITEIKPGLTWWFNENNCVTLNYTHGWVHENGDYDYYGAKFQFGNIIRDGRLTFTFAYGTDPDFNYGTGTSTLSDAYLLSAFYTEPVTENLTVYGGIEYVYRMRPADNGELYQMWTPTIGLSWKF